MCKSYDKDVKKIYITKMLLYKICECNKGKILRWISYEYMHKTVVTKLNEMEMEDRRISMPTMMMWYNNEY